MKVTPSNRLETGTHTGEVVGWERSERGGPAYIDLKVGVEKDGRKVMATCGYPDDLNEGGRLATLLTRFGTPIAVGDDVDVDAALNGMVGRRVAFKVAPDPKNAEFQRIDPRSVRPSPGA